jgi:hypothetical protein
MGIMDFKTSESLPFPISAVSFGLWDLTNFMELNPS